MIVHAAVNDVGTSRSPDDADASPSRSLSARQRRRHATHELRAHVVRAAHGGGHMHSIM
ncbi:MAG: hypothetical protein ABR499_17110 [Gemmatimonadaceae bacterium]